MKIGTGKSGMINTVRPGESIYFSYETPILQDFINATDYLVFEGYPGTQYLICETDKWIEIYNYEILFPLKIHLEGNESSPKNISLSNIAFPAYMAIKNRQPVKFIVHEYTT